MSMNLLFSNTNRYLHQSVTNGHAAVSFHFPNHKKISSRRHDRRRSKPGLSAHCGETETIQSHRSNNAAYNKSNRRRSRRGRRNRRDGRRRGYRIRDRRARTVIAHGIRQILQEANVA